MAEQRKTQEKTLEARDLVWRKASELVALFADYLKGKQVCEGRIGLEAEQDGYIAVLKAATVKPSAEYRVGRRVLLAYYDENEDAYKLKRYSQPVGGRQGTTPVGSYRSAEELMSAVAGEVAKL
jgi:hypothetical protein